MCYNIEHLLGEEKRYTITANVRVIEMKRDDYNYASNILIYILMSDKCLITLA